MLAVAVGLQKSPKQWGNDIVQPPSFGHMFVGELLGRLNFGLELCSINYTAIIVFFVWFVIGEEIAMGC